MSEIKSVGADKVGQHPQWIKDGMAPSEASAVAEELTKAFMEAMAQLKGHKTTFVVSKIDDDYQIAASGSPREIADAIREGAVYSLERLRALLP